NSFTFHERTGPYPQPQVLGTTFKAQVRDYIAGHTERMERFENAIFKQQEEINDRMTEMFELLKELTTSRALEKGEEEKNENDNATTRKSIERLDKSNEKMPLKEVKKENEAENETKQTDKKGSVYEAILKKKITKKEDIGGNFEIPCNIGGIAEYILVDVAGYVYLVNFIILDIKEDEKRPSILGTPFLTIDNVVIKFDKGTITLRTRKSNMSFHRISESPCKIQREIKNDIEPIAPTITMNRLVLE
nr:hypothetical protein [Tanacetum cinerariifolium]